MLGAGSLMGFEPDLNALNLFAENIAGLEIDSVDLTNMDVKNIGAGWKKRFDTVVMNSHLIPSMTRA